MLPLLTARREGAYNQLYQVYPQSRRKKSAQISLFVKIWCSSRLLTTAPILTAGEHGGRLCLSCITRIPPCPMYLNLREPLYHYISRLVLKRHVFALSHTPTPRLDTFHLVRLPNPCFEGRRARKTAALRASFGLCFPHKCRGVVAITIFFLSTTSQPQARGLPFGMLVVLLCTVVAFYSQTPAFCRSQRWTAAVTLHVHHPNTAYPT